jgi:hypothetical protein
MDRFDDLLSAVHSTTVTEVSVLVREVRVRVGVLSKAVSIRIYFDSKSDEPYRFELSALMKPARGQDAREAPRRAASEAEALRKAVRMLTQDYEDAVRQGQMPDDSWLVEGDRFA